MRKKEKKAVSHVEMMISFAIFIIFISLFFIFFNPFKRATVSNESLLDAVDFGIRKNATVDFTTSSLAINEDAYDGLTEDCLEVEGVSERNVIVKNETSIVDSKVIAAGRRLRIKKSGRFYYIYHSLGLRHGSSVEPCEKINEANYTFGVTKTRGIPTLGFLAELNKTYWENYDQLKDEFNFPKSKDFGFVIRNESDDILFDSSRKTLKAFDVMTRQVPLEIINETNADLIFAELQILTW